MFFFNPRRRTGYSRKKLSEKRVVKESFFKFPYNEKYVQVTKSRIPFILHYRHFLIPDINACEHIL